jgi:tRNA pseudouridine13 synthase
MEGRPITDIPFITSDLPGIGGEIKVKSEDFIVQEIPLYDPTDQGDHLFIRIVREGMTTREVAAALAEKLGVSDADVGYAGLKDKWARVTQTFSAPAPDRPLDAVQKMLTDAGLQVEWVRRHIRKLKIGHLLGNAFAVRLVGADADSRAAENIVEALKTRGLPNFYGPQRFGVDGDNVRRGREALTGRGPRQRWLRRYLLSAYQAWLFNRYLTARIERGWFNCIQAGDVAKKTDTGGLFDVEDPAVEAPRFEAGAITFTGPIYGRKMRTAKGEPGELEEAILQEADVTPDMLRKAKLDGSRRPGRLNLPDLRLTADERGLVFCFALPKGAYATTVLREFTRDEMPGGSAGDEQ